MLLRSVLCPTWSTGAMSSQFWRQTSLTLVWGTRQRVTLPLAARLPSVLRPIGRRRRIAAGPAERGGSGAAPDLAVGGQELAEVVHRGRGRGRFMGRCHAHEALGDPDEVAQRDVGAAELDDVVLGPALGDEHDEDAVGLAVMHGAVGKVPALDQDRDLLPMDDRCGDLVGLARLSTLGRDARLVDAEVRPLLGLHAPPGADEAATRIDHQGLRLDPQGDPGGDRPGREGGRPLAARSTRE